MAYAEIDNDDLMMFGVVCEALGRDAAWSIVLLVRWANDHPQQLDYILS